MLKQKKKQIEREEMLNVRAMILLVNHKFPLCACSDVITHENSGHESRRKSLYSFKIYVRESMKTNQLRDLHTHLST